MKAILFLLFFIVVAEAAAQTGTTGQLKGPSTNACTAADKLEVESFTINPAQPTPGQVVTLKLRIRNKCASGTAPITFNWDIAKNEQVLAQGNNQLSPGGGAEFNATWTATAGSHHFYGGITTNHTTLGETQANAQNNTKDLDLTIAVVLETKLLNHVQAKDLGYRFNAVGIGPSTNVCAIAAYGGWSATVRGDFEVGHFIICTLAGGKADFESFGGLTLKNGWTVKSYEVIRGRGNNDGEGVKKGWEWKSAPPSGTNPSFKLHLWADQGFRIYIGVKITIEGPQGTSPF